MKFWVYNALKHRVEALTRPTLKEKLVSWSTTGGITATIKGNFQCTPMGYICRYTIKNMFNFSEQIASILMDDLLRSQGKICVNMEMFFDTEKDAKKFLKIHEETKKLYMLKQSIENEEEKLFGYSVKA